MSAPQTEVLVFVDGREIARHVLACGAHTFGSSATCPVRVEAPLVSRQHARLIVSEDGSLLLEDLGSTNGTFVNRSRIQDSAVNDGDVVHFADLQFQVVASPAPVRRPTAIVQGLPSPQPLISDTVRLRELLRTRAVRIAFQPIVELPSRRVVGHEALGRGNHPGLPEGPIELFRTAAALGAEVELSQLFRRKVVEALESRAVFPPVFVNMHPKELAHPGLLESLAELPRALPQIEFTVEIHEAAIVNVAASLWIVAPIGSVHWAMASR